jgi:hypothetical protein
MVKSIISNLLLTFSVCFLFSCTKPEISNQQKQGVGPIAGGDHYVATWGNDNDSGTFDSPWATWQRALSTANTGDTVYFRGGVWYPTTYAEIGNILAINPNGYVPLGHSGTAENPICFFNYPGETPILDCSQMVIVGNFNTAMMITEAHYIHLKGLTVRNVYQHTSNVQAFGISSTKSSNLTYENITQHNISGRAFTHTATVGYFGITSDTTRYINCDAYNCCDTLNVRPGNAADGWKLDGEPGGFIYLEGCRAWNNSDDGYDMSGNAIGVFKNCWAIGMGGWGQDGNGFKFGGVRVNLATPSYYILNCLAAFNQGTGFGELDFAPFYRSNARIYNNTSYSNGWGYWSLPNAAYPVRNSIYRNNISYKDTVIALINDGGYDLAYCTWVWDFTHYPQNFPSTEVTVTDADFISINPHGLTGPRQADGSLPNLNFLKLAKGSDLINAGVDVGLPGAKGKPDLGAFESNW